MSRIAIGALSALLVFTSCGMPSPGASRPPARVVRGPAADVILQAADVPAEYALENDEAMSDQALADGLGLTTAAIKERFATGYIRAYKDAVEPFRCCLIDSILITVADEAAARATFADFGRSALALGSVETDLGDSVGDDSRVLVFQQPTSDGDLVTVTVLFRYANVVDAVEVTGRPGSFERAYVLEFARKQLARLRAVAEPVR